MRRRLVVVSLACAAALVAIACGNSTGPTYSFSGTYIGRWAGTTGVPDTIHITEPGTAFSGTDIEVASGGEAISVVTGSQYGNSVTFGLSQYGTTIDHYTGAFTSPTVVDGYMHFGIDSAEVIWTHD